MRIGVNLIPLRPGQMGGLEFYVRSLLEYLLVYDKHNQYYLFTADWNDASLSFKGGRHRKILVLREGEPVDNVADGSGLGFTRFLSLRSLRLARRWTLGPDWDFTSGCVAWGFSCGSVR